MLLVRLLVPLFFLTPSEVVCLARYYGATAAADGVVVADQRIPYDDGKPKSADEKLEHPDVKDAFAPRYRTGPIVPVTSPDEDPGRTRLDALFRAAYPTRDLVRIDFAGHKVQVHKKAAAAFLRVSARIAKLIAADKTLAPFVAKLGGTFNPRNIAGTDRPSAHSYGIAIDLNDQRSDYWRWSKSGWRNQIPQAIVDAFEAEGFIWGGRWFHFDTMHFEWRPELLDGSCYPPAP
ncbi:MAG: M15 family metallopeptidase [Polyangia bacterium]